MAQQDQGSGFVNLNKLIAANQQNQLGSTIQSGVQNQANKVTGDTTSAFNDFQNQANAQNLNTDANKQYISNTLSAFGAPPPNDPNVTSQTNGGSTDTPSATPLDDPGNAQSNAQASGTNSSSSPTSQPFSGVNAGQVSAFDTFRNGAYNGPTQLNNFNNLQAEAQTTQQLGQNTSTSGGRQQLLQQFAGGNNGLYSQGEQNLDNIILGQTGAGNLTAARRATQGITNTVNQAGSNASNLANTVAAGNKAFGDYTTQQVNNTYNPLNDLLNQQVTGAQSSEATREASLQAIQNLLSKDPSSFSNTSTLDGAALDPNAANYKQQLAANNLSLGQQALQKLTDAGLISNQDPGSGTNPSPTAGLVPAFQDQYGLMFTYTDPKTGQFVTQKSNGLWTYDGGPQNGQVYTPPGTDPGSQKTQWSNLLNNLNTFNTSAPESVNYDQILSQAITDNAAQNVSRSGLGNQNQLAKLNALDQLLGKSQEFGLTPTTNANGTTTPTYGNYTAGNQSFDQSRALNAIQAITNPNAAPLSTGASPSAASGPNLPSQVASNVLLGGVPLGNQVLTGIGGVNNGITNAIGNVSSGVQNAISNLTGGGGGGGGKIICNELHRQGYIPADIIVLDEAYGVAFRKHYPEIYLGYLTVARPIVRAMKKSKLVTKLVSLIAIPWSKAMAHQMDRSHPNSLLGMLVHNTFAPILLGVYKICKLKKLGRKNISHS